jgi:hypothetical protein
VQFSCVESSICTRSSLSPINLAKRNFLSSNSWVRPVGVRMCDCTLRQVWNMLQHVVPSTNARTRRNTSWPKSTKQLAPPQRTQWASRVTRRVFWLCTRCTRSSFSTRFGLRTREERLGHTQKTSCSFCCSVRLVEKKLSRAFATCEFTQ